MKLTKIVLLPFFSTAILSQLYLLFMVLNRYLNYQSTKNIVQYFMQYDKLDSFLRCFGYLSNFSIILVIFGTAALYVVKAQLTFVTKHYVVLFSLVCFYFADQIPSIPQIVLECRQYVYETIKIISGQLSNLTNQFLNLTNNLIQ